MGDPDAPAPPFGLGPEWVWGTTCCGKPVGCTNMSGQCLMQGHPWKRRYAQETDDPGRQET